MRTGTVTNAAAMEDADFFAELERVREEDGQTAARYPSAES